MSAPPPPPPRLAQGPNPGICENGKVLCNEPLRDHTETIIGYCSLAVWPPSMQGRWLRRPGHPGKPHTVSWWTR